MTDNNYAEVLLEDMNGKFELILEAVGGMQDQVKKIPKMSERLEKIEHDVNTIKLDTSLMHGDTRMIKIRTEKLEDIQDELRGLKKRVNTLEAHH
jgi:archaellum component FlaC